MQQRAVSTKVAGRPAGAAAVGVLLCALVAGCALPPVAPIEKASVHLPADWNGADVGAPSAAGLDHWWRPYGDPVLDDWVERALANNREAAVAAHRLRAARALAGAARAPWSPQLAAMVQPSPVTSGRDGYLQAGFDASWEWPLFGRDEAARALADAEVGSARSDLQAVRVTLVAEVVRTRLEQRAARRATRLLEQVLDEALAAQARTRRRIALRLAAADDAPRASAALEAARQAVLEQRGRLDGLAERLRVLLGDGQAALPDDAPAPAWTALPHPVLPPPADAVRRRPDVARAERQVDRAAAAVGLARADYAPHLSLTGTLGAVAGLRGPDAGGLRALVAAGPVLHLPLFDAGQRDAALAARRAELQAAVAAYEQAALAGVAEARTALSQWTVAAQRVQSGERAVADLAAREDAARRRLALGLGDAQALGDARLARLQAGIDVQQAQLAEGLAAVALHKALGGAPPDERSAGP